MRDGGLCRIQGECKEEGGRAGQPASQDADHCPRGKGLTQPLVSCKGRAWRARIGNFPIP